MNAAHRTTWPERLRDWRWQARQGWQLWLTLLAAALLAWLIPRLPAPRPLPPHAVRARITGIGYSRSAKRPAAMLTIEAADGVTGTARVRAQDYPGCATGDWVAAVERGVSLSPRPTRCHG